MKRLFSLFFFIVASTVAAQELFQHELDSNFLISIPDNSEEGEYEGRLFVTGSIDGHKVIIIRSDKLQSRSAIESETSLLRLYQGVRDGMLKSTKGTVVNEQMIEVARVKALNFSFMLTLENQQTTVENFIIYWKKTLYTLQFMPEDKPSEDFKITRQTIIDSIELL